MKAILADEKKLLGVIKDELLVISQKYGDERRTALGRDVDEVTDEELIERENIVITMTKLGYISVCRKISLKHRTEVEKVFEVCRRLMKII